MERRERLLLQMILEMRGHDHQALRADNKIEKEETALQKGGARDIAGLAPCLYQDQDQDHSHPMQDDIDTDHIDTDQNHGRGQDQDLHTPDEGQVDTDAHDQGQDQDHADIDVLEADLTFVTVADPVPDPDHILVPEDGTLALPRGDVPPEEDAATIITPGRTEMPYMTYMCVYSPKQ